VGLAVVEVDEAAVSEFIVFTLVDHVLVQFGCLAVYGDLENRPLVIFIEYEADRYEHVEQHKEVETGASSCLPFVRNEGESPPVFKSSAAPHLKSVSSQDVFCWLPPQRRLHLLHIRAIGSSARLHDLIRQLPLRTLGSLLAF